MTALDSAEAEDERLELYGVLEEEKCLMVFVLAYELEI
jgi:hypothetical protein